MRAFMDKGRHFWLTLAGLGLITGFGAWLRLTGLSAATICHAEMYVPGIRLPDELAEPHSRLTLVKTLTGTFSADTHPPGYYVLMLGWTKLLGTSLAAMRFPSALAGIAAIPLLFCAGALAGNRQAGWIAAAMLAASGFHVFWSQVARMYAPACFFGLLATVLLLLIVRGGGQRRLLWVAYAAAVLLGVASHIFFWPVFLTHMLWVLVNARAGGQPLPGIARLQILLLILASPLLAFAAYQSGNTLAPMRDQVLLFAREFLTFGFLFPQPAITDLFRASNPPFSWAWRHAYVSIAAAILFVFSVLLIAIALKIAKRETGAVASDPAGPSRRAWIAAGAAGFLAICIFIGLAYRFARPEPYPTIRLTRMLAVLPLLLSALAAALEAYWDRVPAWGRRLWDNRLFIGRQALLLMLALVPFGTIAAITLVKPMLNQRGLLIPAPYLLFLLAMGLSSLLRTRWAAAIVCVVLGASHIVSLAAYRGMAVGPTDYKGFYAALAPRIEPGDLVFMRHRWNATPILYYLSTGKFRLTGKDYASACARNPGARIWVLWFGTTEFDPEIRDAIRRYQPAGAIEVGDAHAMLYTRGPAAAALRRRPSPAVYRLQPFTTRSGLARFGKSKIGDRHEVSQKRRNSSQSPFCSWS